MRNMEKPAAGPSRRSIPFLKMKCTLVIWFKTSVWNDHIKQKKKRLCRKKNGSGLKILMNRLSMNRLFEGCRKGLQNDTERLIFTSWMKGCLPEDCFAETAESLWHHITQREKRMVNDINAIFAVSIKDLATDTVPAITSVKTHWRK